jgi:hypothetical protein
LSEIAVVQVPFQRMLAANIPKSESRCSLEDFPLASSILDIIETLIAIISRFNRVYRLRAVPTK